MKYLLAIILIAVGPFTDLDRIATINKLKKEAKEAYNNGNYQKALNNYKYLVDSMEVVDESINLNIANAYYMLKDSSNAVNKYHQLADSKNNNVRSVAQQQLGVIANKNKKYKEALDHFKEALKADPSNEDARYNYELLKKILKEQEKQQDPKDQQQEQEKKDQEKKDQEKKEKSDKSEDKEGESEEKPEDSESKEDQEGEKKEQEGKEEEQKDKKDGEKKDEEGKDKKEEPQEPQEGEESDKPTESKDDQMNSLSDKFQEMNISEEKAKMILEALKNREIQYYQQKKRGATKRSDPDKPDW